MLVERGQQASPHVNLARGGVPAGSEQFIHRAMRETGCSRSLAISAVRLIVRQHRPHADRLRAYLAKFSAADLSHWVERALDAERAALAALLINDFAEQVKVDSVLGSEADRLAEADRRRAAFLRAYPVARSRPEAGMRRLDEALEQLRQSSGEAARAIDAVGGAPFCEVPSAGAPHASRAGTPVNRLGDSKGAATPPEAAG